MRLRTMPGRSIYRSIYRQLRSPCVKIFRWQPEELGDEISFCKFSYLLFCGKLGVLYHKASSTDVTHGTPLVRRKFSNSSLLSPRALVVSGMGKMVFLRKYCWYFSSLSFSYSSWSICCGLYGLFALSAQSWAGSMGCQPLVIGATLAPAWISSRRESQSASIRLTGDALQSLSWVFEAGHCLLIEASDKTGFLVFV